jgi:hypothetical protein
MRKDRITLRMIVGIAVIAFVSAAVADPSFRTTRVNFSAPVRVPGANLTAGTYYFQAPNSNNRLIVRIQDENRQFVTQFMGIPDKTRNRTHDIVLYGEQACGPTAIKSWFFPESNTGVRFVYPQAEAELIAASCNEDVPETHETKLEETQVEGIKVYVMTPQKKEQAYDESVFSASDARDGNGFDAAH